MSEEFEVRGPHEELADKVGEAAHETGDTFASRLAVITALLATLGALFSYQVGATQNEAAMDKNNAAMKKTEAANQWNYYQAKSNKQNLAELAAALPGVDTARYRRNGVRYGQEKEVIRRAAEQLEAASTRWDEASEAVMHQHHRWALAMTALQIAIALAAIALLTRKRWLQWGVYGVALLGVGLGVLAGLHL
ncbi:MAG: hypothetical protein NVS3B25_26400 [Hymenobacter sp.]